MRLKEYYLHRNTIRFLIVLFCVLVPCLPSFAEDFSRGDRITLTSTITVTLLKGNLEFALELANNGNATATAVHPRILFSNFERFLDQRDIAPGEMVTFRLKEEKFVENWLHQKGSYVMKTFIPYLDAVGKKHVTAAYGELLYGIGSSQRLLEVNTKPEVVRRKENLSVEIKNPGTENLHAMLHVFSGEGLMFYPPQQNLSIAPGASVVAHVRVENPAHVSRTTLPAFTVLSYESEEMKLSQVDQVALTLSAEEENTLSGKEGGYPSRLVILLSVFFFSLGLIVIHGLSSRSRTR